MTLKEINSELTILNYQIESIDLSWDYKNKSLVEYWSLIEPIKDKISRLEDHKKIKRRVK